MLDVFDEEGDELALGSKDYTKLNKHIEKEAFIDGVEEGKNTSLIKGFDCGLQRSFSCLKSIHILRGSLIALSSLKGYIDLSQKEKDDIKLINNLLHNIDLEAQQDLMANREINESTKQNIEKAKSLINDLFKHINKPNLIEELESVETETNSL